MRRTNIYLDEPQLLQLRRLGQMRGEPVAVLVRQAVDDWLSTQGVQLLDEDEWAKRFDALLARRRNLASRYGFEEAQVERDVTSAISEVRGRQTDNIARRR
jgi:hypothetical protein